MLPSGRITGLQLTIPNNAGYDDYVSLMHTIPDRDTCHTLGLSANSHRTQQRQLSDAVILNLKKLQAMRKGGPEKITRERRKKAMPTIMVKKSNQQTMMNMAIIITLKFDTCLCF